MSRSRGYHLTVCALPDIESPTRTGPNSSAYGKDSSRSVSIGKARIHYKHTWCGYTVNTAKGVYSSSRDTRTMM